MSKIETNNPLMRGRGLATGPRKRLSTKSDAVSNEILSKLIQATNSGTAQKDERLGGRKPSQQYIQDVAAKTATQVSDAKNAMAILSDLQLGAQILVSTIIAPQDMTSNEVTYKCTDDRFSDFEQPLLEVIQKYFDDDYKIKTRFSPWLYDILFYTGSVPMVVLPESSIDHIINSDATISQESWDSYQPNRLSTIGFLGNRTNRYGLKWTTAQDVTTGSISTEALDRSGSTTAYDPHVADNAWHITVTDDYDALKLSMLNKRRISQAVRTIAKNKRNRGQASFENNTGGADQNSEVDKLFKPRQYSQVPIEAVTSPSHLERKSVGYPVDKQCRSEAFIPVYAPGSPEVLMGGFIVLDPSGNDISISQDANWMANIRKTAQAPGDQTSQMLGQARTLQDGNNIIDNNRILEASALFEDAVERDLRERLKNGIYGQQADFDFGKPQHVYRMMMARALAQKHTQLLYIPSEFLTYMAFDYNEDGVGQSLLEATKVLTGIRSMLLVANTLGAINNSINHKKLGVTFDEADQNPDQTLEQILDDVVKMSNPMFPFSMSNPAEQWEFLARAGWQVETSGNVNYPETKVNVDYIQGNNIPVNTELEEGLRKRHLQAIGVPPEIVDTSNSIEFATSIITSNILFSKRAMQLQDRFVHFVSQFIRQYVNNAEPLLLKLRQIVKDNWTKLNLKGEATEHGIMLVVERFIESVHICLPRADLAKLEVQSKDFDTFVEFLDKTLPAHIRPEMFDDKFDGDIKGAVDALTESTRAYFIRRYMQENNIMPQLFELSMQKDASGKHLDIFQEEGEYMRALEKAILPFLHDRLKVAAAVNKDLEADLKKNEESASGVGSGGGDDFGGGDGGFGGDGGMGGDDFSMDMPAGGADGVDDTEQSTSDQPPEEEETPSGGSTF